MHLSEARLFAALEATWPARRAFWERGFTFREGAGGGSRVSAASWAGTDAPEGHDLDFAERRMKAMAQSRLFILRQSQTALDAMLAGRGYRIKDPVWFYALDLRGLRMEPVADCFTIWPPLAVQADIWAEGGIDPARLAVMDRVAGPKTTVFARYEDRIAGTGFLACDGHIAMLHAVETRKALRRRGVARRMMSHMAPWARDARADWLTLVATRANVAAHGLYQSMGFTVVGGYHYRIHPDDGPPEITNPLGLCP